MELDETVRIVTSLAAGQNPFTGCALAQDSLLQDPEVVRALFGASAALADAARLKRRRAALPANCGKLWSAEDDERLSVGFEGGSSLPDLASELRRSVSSVRMRLVKLGKIDEAGGDSGGQCSGV